MAAGPSTDHTRRVNVSSVSIATITQPGLTSGLIAQTYTVRKEACTKTYSSCASRVVVVGRSFRIANFSASSAEYNATSSCDAAAEPADNMLLSKWLPAT